MATIYVSQTATNGYAVGDDARTRANAASKSTPVLTVTRALAVSENNDIIVINDGIYAEDSYIAPVKTGLTINAQNDYMVTIRAASGTTRVLHQANTGAGLILGKIILDANGTQGTVITTDSSNTVASLTLKGTRLVNFTQYGLSSMKLSNVTLQDKWLIESLVCTNINSNGIVLTSPGAATYNIKDGTINLATTNNVPVNVYGIKIASGDVSLITDISGNAITINNTSTGTQYIYGVSVVATHAGCKTTITDNTITTGSSKSCTQRGIYSVGQVEYTIADNTVVPVPITGDVSTFRGIEVPNSAILTNKCWIYNNEVGGVAKAFDLTGTSVLIGNDVDVEPATHDSINGIWAYGNTANNYNHGVFLGWVTGGTVVGNNVNHGTIGVIGKHTTRCLFTGNIIDGIGSGGALRSKGSANDVFANNTVIMTTESEVTGLAISCTNATTGAVFANNIIYMSGIAALAVIVADTSAATFFSNDYYTDSSFAENPFAYQGTTYANLAAWIAAQESTALNINPAFVSYPTDLRIPASNTGLYHAGVKKAFNARDYNLRPYYIKPTIGAYEVSGGDTCLARKARS